ncbi:helix-turn-helix domain-containing protein [Kineococcus sp. R8]|uniref:DJ-1/PfpI family protein n=1 Tax=Kineococcus siccus TaxID=2696567 RepID=UPI001412D5D4|nr:helix-turn-helix domain-containing protein [Kineococcus siccus]
MEPPAASPHVVAVVLFQGVDAVDVTGPAEVFSTANWLLRQRGREPRYEVHHLADRAGPVRTVSGVRLYADETFDGWRLTPDTLLVPGGIQLTDDGPVPVIDATAVEWIREAGREARRIVSICAGTHLTAAAGLLRGHRATTHWSTVDRLAAEQPLVQVERDPIFVRSGHVWTSAGMTASLDLALALVAEDHGAELSLEVARIMVMYLQRPGGQSQLSVPLARSGGGRRDLRDLRSWMGENLDGDLSVPALASRMSLSERHFARLFLADTGITPAVFVEQLRIEGARRMVEQTDLLPRQIARFCGLGSVETLHRVFRTHLGTTPGEYRRRFRPAQQRL